MNKSGYEELKTAILARAIEDWARLDNNLTIGNYTMTDKNCLSKKNALTKWFRSEWCDALSSGMDGDRLIELAMKRSAIIKMELEKQRKGEQT